MLQQAATGGPPHAPPEHVSGLVQASPSSQGVSLALAGVEHWPVAVLQVPATWHWSSALQVTGLEPVQVPFWHVSVCVQASPSSHAVPLELAGSEHAPVAGLQVPAGWHWSEAVQTTGSLPVPAPPSQVSVRAPRPPSL